MAAKRRIASRYSLRAASVVRRRCASASPRSRPATARLAASRLTSHSNGPGEGLVEVVEVEDEPPLGRREHAEVREVGVAAELRRQARSRGAREVGRHDRGRARKKVNGEASIRP